MYPPPKKRFGQHFLRDLRIAERIAGTLSLDFRAYSKVLEVGPGQGILTQFLFRQFGENLYLSEIDRDLIEELKTKFPELKDQIIVGDFLDLDMTSIFHEQVGVIGNFPYNISSQIIFKVVANRQMIPEMAGMFQKEVAQRVVAGPGSKVYGLISAWVQAFYDCEYLFTVNEGSFFPPPKVKSGVIRLTRKNREEDFDSDLLLTIIKAAFNQRRKTLRNSLRIFGGKFNRIEAEILDKRAEALGAEDYIRITKAFSE